MKSIELWQQLAEEIVPIPLFWALRGLDVFLEDRFEGRPKVAGRTAKLIKCNLRGFDIPKVRQLSNGPLYS